MAALRLSISESKTIELAFNLFVSRYLAQLATQACLLLVLVLKLFLVNVPYDNNARYVAALLNDTEHLFELAPNGERYFAYEIAFTAALTCHLSNALSAG